MIRISYTEKKRIQNNLLSITYLLDFQNIQFAGKMLKNLLFTILVIHANLESTSRIHCDREYANHLDSSYDDEATLSSQSRNKGLCYCKKNPRNFFFSTRQCVIEIILMLCKNKDLAFVAYFSSEFIYFYIILSHLPCTASFDLCLYIEYKN